MFLSRLNEISGGCEKIVSVSESFWSNLKFFKNDRLDCVVAKVKCESEWNAVSVLRSVVARLNERNRIATLPLVFSKNHSRHNINDEV